MLVATYVYQFFVVSRRCQNHTISRIYMVGDWNQQEGVNKMMTLSDVE